MKHGARILTALFLPFALMGPASAQVVALGASNTEGRGVSSSESFPAQLQAMLQARGSSLRVTNAGVSGDTTGGMLARLSRVVPDGTKIVILQFGGNDLRRNISPAARQANIASIQQELRTRNQDGSGRWPRAVCPGGWAGPTGPYSSNCGGLSPRCRSTASFYSLNSQDVFVLDENTTDVPGRRIRVASLTLGLTPMNKIPGRRGGLGIT